MLRKFLDKVNITSKFIRFQTNEVVYSENGF